MARFLYKAKRGPGELLEGNIAAGSERIAIDKLSELGYYPLWVKEAPSYSEDRKTRIPFFSKQIKSKDIANFTRQLSDLLDSGLVLFDSLNIIENQAQVHELKEVVRGIRDDIRRGKSFSESLRNYPIIFSNLYINLVKAGESGGILSETLSNIADSLEKQEGIKLKVSSALAYPILMMVVGFATVLILIGFVIPKLSDMFVEFGQTLPLPTRILIGLSDFIRRYWIFLGSIIAGLVFFIKKSKSNRISKMAMDNLKLKLPFFGTLVRNIELARFSRTLSDLLKNGVSVPHALKITSDVIDNEIIKQEVLCIYSDVKAGARLASAIKKKTSFPKFVVNMTAIGEEGGFLDRALSKVTKSYELEIDRAVRVMSSLLEPVMILIIGLILGFIVVSMLLPVFELSLAPY